MTNSRGKARSPETPDGDIYTTVDEETYDDLSRLVGQRVVYAAVWEDSVADALEPSGENADESLADMDVYLKDGAYFELFGVATFEGLDEEPMAAGEALHRRLTARVAAGLWLVDVAVDDEDALVLVLGEKGDPSLYLAVGAWALGEWEELPEG